MENAISSPGGETMKLPTCQLFARKQGLPVVVGTCRLEIKDDHKVAVFEVIDPEYAAEIADLEKGIDAPISQDETKPIKLVPDNGLRFISALPYAVRGRDFWASNLTFEEHKDQQEAA